MKKLSVALLLGLSLSSVIASDQGCAPENEQMSHNAKQYVQTYLIEHKPVEALSNNAYYKFSINRYEYDIEKLKELVSLKRETTEDFQKNIVIEALNAIEYRGIFIVHNRAYGTPTTQFDAGVRHLESLKLLIESLSSSDEKLSLMLDRITKTISAASELSLAENDLEKYGAPSGHAYYTDPRVNRMSKARNAFGSAIAIYKDLYGIGR